MKLSEQEKAARRAAFRNMSRKKKLEHVSAYYKWPILLGLIALFLLGSLVQKQLTKKTPMLYLAFANVAAGEELKEALTTRFLNYIGADNKKQEVYLYPDLYLSDDATVENHEYAYASRIKLMGAISAGKIDLLLMNREAYDLLSRKGYLMELSSSCFADESSLRDKLRTYLSVNEVVLSDNVLAYQLGEVDTHEMETVAAENAIEVSDLPLFSRAGFSDSVYLGIIANSQRLATCIQYMEYLLLGT